MEVDGSIKGNVSVEEGLSAQRDEVTTHGEEQERKEEGDGSSCAARDDHTDQGGLREACRLSLQTIV